MTNNTDPVQQTLLYCLARLELGPGANPNDGLVLDVRKAIVIAEQQAQLDKTIREWKHMYDVVMTHQFDEEETEVFHSLEKRVIEELAKLDALRAEA